MNTSAREIPVYLFTGFLEAGKTKFIQETFEDPRFNNGENTLLLVCEEGIEEYDPSRFKGDMGSFHAVNIDSPEELTADHLSKLQDKNFSTFLGRAGLYLEDLFVKPEYRGKGYGKAILKKLAAIAVERGCGRLEWSCLDWNKPSIDFYRSLGAVPMEEWTVYRVTGETLKKLAE